MPYPHEHAGRVSDPKNFVRFRRVKRKHKGKEYSLIRGQKKDGSWEDQAFRYPTKFWDAKTAKAHAIDRGAKSFEPAAPRKEASFAEAIVHVDGLADPPLPCSAINFSGDKEDFPTCEFIKEVIHTGDYCHPKKDWQLPVTVERMDNWVLQFDRMQGNGVSVPIVKDHRITTDATLGYAKKLFRDGDKLKVRLEARGADSIDAVQRVNYVSLGLRNDFTDGEGNEYGEVIEHIGMTPVPVVPAQEDIVRIAASRGQSSQEIPVFRRLATEDNTMDLKELRKVLGLGDDVELTEENALEAIQNKVAEGTVAEEKVKELNGKVTSLSSELTKLKESGGDDTPTISPDQAEDAAEGIAEEVAEITASLGLAPADAKELTEALTGPPEDRNTYLLSRVPAPDSNGRRPIRARVITGLLKKIDLSKAIQTGSRTGVQTFSRADDNSDTEESQEEIKARAEAAYG